MAAAPAPRRDAAADPTAAARRHHAAVSRSSELLACARTALRLAKAEREQQDDGTGRGALHPSPLASVRAEDLHLWRPPPSSSSQSNDPLGFTNEHGVGATGDAAEVDDEYYHSLPPPERAIIDAASILRAVDLTVSDLQSLVRRRGHTNDPTEEIGRCMNRFQSLTKELLQAAEAIKAPPRRGVGRQYKRHYEVVAAEVQKCAKERTERFQAALAARGEVLKEQAQRRKMLSAGASGGAAAVGSNGAVPAGGRRPAGAGAAIGRGVGSSSSNASGAALAQLDSPLFTMTTGVGAGAAAAAAAAAKPYARSSSSAAAVAAGATAASANPSHDGGVRSAPTSSHGYGGQKRARQQQQQQQPSHGYGGQRQQQAQHYQQQRQPYAAASSASGGGGMRRRGGHQYDGGAATSGASYSQFAYSSAAAASSSTSTPYYAQRQQQQQEDESTSSSAQHARSQIKKRREARDTRARLDSARAAERAVAELGQMFGKMATLVQSQSEIVESIEDDVEASMDHVTAGSEEIVKLYHITRGNRGLILKVFALLIFFVLFFKLY